MAQLIKQANIFGRIGSGIGQGLAEQIPKEVERHRLASGLKELGEKKGLTPFQRFAELSAIPGITPQQIESGSKLLRDEASRNPYLETNELASLSAKNQPQAVSKPQENQADVQGNTIKGAESRVVPSNAVKQPQINPVNPLSPSLVPLAPWTPQRKEQEVGNILKKFPQMDVPQALALAEENEKRELSLPAHEREKFEQREKDKVDLDNDLTKKMNLKLHSLTDKEGNKTGLYKDLSGDALEKIRRSAEEDLRTDPSLSLEDVSNKWSQKALEISQTNGNLTKLANRDIFDKLIKTGETYDKLKNYAKTYKEANLSEDYKNKLISEFGLSPETASFIALDPSPAPLNYIKGLKEKSNFAQPMENSRKYAKDIANLMTNEDSILSLVKHLRLKYPRLDQKEFFDEMENYRNRFSAAQKEELNIGQSEILPRWADILTLPYYQYIQKGKK